MHSRRGRFLAVAALLAGAVLFIARPALASYTIYLKDGGHIQAKDKPTIQGKSLIFESPTGAPQSMPLSEVDMAKTEEANKSGLGGAYVLGDAPKSLQTGPPPEKKPSLSEYIKVHKVTDMEGAQAPTTAEAARDQGMVKSAPPKKGAPAAAEDASVLDPLLNDTFARALETSGIRGARFSTAPGGVKVVAVTDSEQQVFAALGAVARGLKESRAGGRNITKVEVVLATAAGEPAGRFDMTPDDAESLLNGKVSSPKYFVANVQF